jgi:hypothetical protein
MGHQCVRRAIWPKGMIVGEELWEMRGQPFKEKLPGNQPGSFCVPFLFLTSFQVVGALALVLET